MKPLKFRAYDKVRKEMFTVGNLFIDMRGKIYLDTLEYNNPQDRFEIMQFTGLRDKQGVEIYEGDTVQWDDKASTDDGIIWKSAVEFKDCAFVVRKDWPLGSLWDRNSLEVIGNIHQHPELLK